MNDRISESREAIQYAREALNRGSTSEARQWAERAAHLAPQTEDPWLILAAVSGPRESVGFARKALEANPHSPRAKQGMEWAVKRLRESSGGGSDSRNRNQAQGPARSGSGKTAKKRSPLFPFLLVVMGCAVLGFAAWSAMTSPVLASILSLSSVPQVVPTHAQSFALAEIAKPTYTAVPLEVVSIVQSEAPTILPAATSTPTPTEEPPPTATFAPEATSTPGVMYVEIVPDTPTPEYVAPTAAPYKPSQAGGGGGAHWIDVDLSEQRVYAYEGDTIVNSFLASTGTWQTPTVTGKFKIWIKLRSTDMSGPGYYLPDVPYTMFFYGDYALHGTYWHNNFGTPMSHGCVNLSIPDAAWLYNFAAVGTVVNVHY